MIDILIADDHPIYRIGLVNVINEKKNFLVKYEVDNGLDALNIIIEKRPVIAILDIEMPKITGLEVCEQLKTKGVNTKIIILTLYKEKSLYEKAISFGVMGYLLKERAIEELEQAINEVYLGRNFVSKDIQELLNTRTSYLLKNGEASPLIINLTDSEKAILKLIADKKTTKEIAAKLFVSEKTIEKHRYNIIKKLNLEPGQNSLLKFAIENNVLLNY
jgi:DNA-binding NarL/FixJ family response regulator